MDSLQAETIDDTQINSRFAADLLSEIQKRWSGWLIITLGVLSVLFFAVQIFQWIDQEQAAWIGDISTAMLASGSFILAWRVTRHPLLDDASRRSWQLLMLSYFAYACGEGLWLFFSKFLEIEPFPSWADVGYLSFYPLMLAALLLFPTAQNYTRSDKLKLAMDVAIVMIGTTVVVWYFIINPTLAGATEEEWLKPVLAVSYVVGDIVMLLGVATVLLRGVAEANRRTLFIIIGGLAAFAFADLGFAYLTVQNLYTSGHWIDNFWIIGDFALLFSAHYQYVQISQPAADEENIKETVRVQAFSWLPYLAIVLGCGLLLSETRPFWSEPLGMIVFASLAMTALVVFRQIAAVKENVRLLAEQAARQSEIRFRSLVEHSSDMIAILDLKGDFTYQSPSFKTILGYENDELIGRNSLEFVRSEDLQNIKNDFKSLIDDPQTILVREYHFKHKNGAWKILESITKSINEEENNMSGILFNLRDVTERREAENKLQAFTVKLERSNRELQDFAYVASHDLQEPLRKVQAFGDRLERKCAADLTEEGRDYINRMRNAAGRMQNLINDLLTFSRVSTKTQPFKPTDLKEIAEDVVSDLEVRIEQTGGRVEIGELPTIDADPLQMRQLLQNLIGNALKFHRPDVGPVVKVYARTALQTGASFILEGEEIQTSDGDGICRLVIEDNGIGFDEKYLDRIFTVFQRLHGRAEYEGSGIGLAVCRKIVERHGGDLTAASKQGKGAAFYINLPITQEKITVHETRS